MNKMLIKQQIATIVQFNTKLVRSWSFMFISFSPLA